MYNYLRRSNGYFVINNSYLITLPFISYVSINANFRIYYLVNNEYKISNVVTVEKETQ